LYEPLLGFKLAKLLFAAMQRLKGLLKQNFKDKIVKFLA
jgi:hypothetical protein